MDREGSRVVRATGGRFVCLAQPVGRERGSLLLSAEAPGRALLVLLSSSAADWSWAWSASQANLARRSRQPSATEPFTVGSRAVFLAPRTVREPNLPPALTCAPRRWVGLHSRSTWARLEPSCAASGPHAKRDTSRLRMIFSSSSSKLRCGRQPSARRRESSRQYRMS